MLSGTALSFSGTPTRIFAAEPSLSGADDLRRGLATGQRIEAVSSATVADGLRTPVGEWPWRVITRDEADPIARAKGKTRLVDGAYAVGEREIARALRLVLERMKVVVEPSAVVGLAVALYDEDFRAMVEREGGAEGWDVGVILTGGNLELDKLAQILALADD